MIPKVINYCWFGNKKIPNNIRKCMDSWKKFCPDYKIIRWDENNFNVYNNSFTTSAYESKAWAFVSDYARLKIIYENGGIYLDTDIELLKSLNPLLKNKFYIGYQQLDGLCNTGLGFGAEKGNRIVKKMLDQYKGLIYSDKKCNSISSPQLNDPVIRELGYKNQDKIWKKDGATIYPPKYFDPISVGDTQILKCTDSYSMSLYLASWTSFKNRLKRKIANMIGQEKVNKLKHMRFLQK